MLKHLVLVGAAILVFSLAGVLGAEEAKTKEKGGVIKSGVKSIVSDTVSAGKDLMSGISEGVDEGRRETESADGARVASAKDDLPRLSLTADVVKVKYLDEDSSQVELTVALKNPNDFPVRITNLSDLRNVVLVDEDGFSYPLAMPAREGRDVTALGRSATRLKFTFSGLESKADTFRFFDHDIKIKSDAVVKPAPGSDD
ncbi:hypothetical protein LJB99_01185 [Deltaproteobacteria bacterium OttesenSCG-928-K17]|nr:hypothetical protein [Deltaproteobacteria bacterium OttesenSCG-928-K17]